MDRLRRIVRVVPDGTEYGVYAVADDGTAWHAEKIADMWQPWAQLPALPPAVSAPYARRVVD